MTSRYAATCSDKLGRMGALIAAAVESVSMSVCVCVEGGVGEFFYIVRRITSIHTPLNQKAQKKRLHFTSKLLNKSFTDFAEFWFNHMNSSIE